jgi:hypothetical protein
MTDNNQSDAKLAAKIVAAVKEFDAADATRKEKAIIAGKLLAEAQDRHPTEQAFKKFLQLAGGIQYSRARELIGIAIGRKNFEQQQAENAARQQRHRDKLKAERQEKALPKPEPKPEPKGKEKPELEPTEPAAPLRNGPQAELDGSTASLSEFKRACKTYLPKLDMVDLQKAVGFFCSEMSKLAHEMNPTLNASQLREFRAAIREMKLQRRTKKAA